MLGAAAVDKAVDTCKVSSHLVLVIVCCAVELLSMRILLVCVSQQHAIWYAAVCCNGDSATVPLQHRATCALVCILYALHSHSALQAVSSEIRLA
jgi:hypothetical protein